MEDAQVNDWRRFERLSGGGALYVKADQVAAVVDCSRGASAIQTQLVLYGGRESFLVRETVHEVIERLGGEECGERGEG